MKKAPLFSGLPRLRSLFAVVLLVSGAATPIFAQGADEGAFVIPRWAEPALQGSDPDSGLRELEKLPPSYRNYFEYPYLQAKLWGFKVNAAGNKTAKIAALQQQHRFLMRAISLGGGATSAAVMAEIQSDLRDTQQMLRAEGVTNFAAPTTQAPGQFRPSPVRRPTVAKRPTTGRRVAVRPVATRPTQSAPVKKLHPLARRPGYVIGRAIFADGRPIPSFTVSVMGYDGQVNLSAGSTPSLGYGEGKNGRYAIRTMDTFRRQKPVSGLVTAMRLTTKVRYLGKDYTMLLHPIDGIPDGGSKGQFKASSGPGIVRDFVLKIAGVKPRFKEYNLDENNGPNEATTFYGAQLTLDLSYGEGNGEALRTTAPGGSQLVVTLVPQGPLLDGSRGQTLVRSVRLKETGANYAFYLRNIPIGAYSVSAQLITPSGETWNLRGKMDSRDYSSTNSVVFPPSFSDLIGGPDTVVLYLVR